MNGLKKSYQWLYLCLLFGAMQGESTEYRPWFGNIYEFEFRTSFIYQSYSKISSGSSLENHSSDDLFLHASLSSAITDLSFEGEIVEARTRHQKGDIDQLKITGRYVWENDLAGDPWSLTTGMSYTQAFQRSLNDISSFHHGLYEGEAFLSMGKEFFFETGWNHRWWSVVGVGIAERGSPWIRFYVVYEKCLQQNRQELQLLLHSLWGLGHKKLHFHDFSGYGPIRHQSVDLGLRYIYLLDYFGSASLEYAYRVHAENFPAYAHYVIIKFLYTFGL